MNQKYNITKLVLEACGLAADDKRIRQTIPTWWVNPRKKGKGGLRLTEQGFECLRQADLKFHEIRIEEPVFFNNQMIIWIDQNIDCPFYINNKKIWVTSEKMAVQLVLFSGNIQKFQRAQKRFVEKQKSS